MAGVSGPCEFATASSVCYQNTHLLCTVASGEYCHPLRNKLAAHDAASSSAGREALPVSLQGITTPLKLEYWQQQLGSHPDGKFAQLILKGTEQGFKIGFQHSSSQLRSKGGNMLSTRSHPEVVSEYIATELALGRIAEVGPVEAAKKSGIQSKNGVTSIFNYLDDFLTLGKPDSDECQLNLTTMLATCNSTGLPVEVDKCQGPVSCILFLGMELDSVALEICLPVDKLANLKSLLHSWRGRKACRKRELLSLTGSLSHACKAVRSGRAFLRRLML